MANLKRLTAKKKKFLDHYNISGSVVEASKSAGYTQPGSCYRLVEQDASGVYTDETVRLYLAQLNGVAPKPRPFASVLPFPSASVDDMDSPTVESVHKLLWTLAQDSTMTGGARVAAATALLKDLRGEPVEVEVSEEEAVADIMGVLGVG